MNSWMSRLLSACTPPLMTFIIGTGISRPRPAPPRRPSARRSRLTSASTVGLPRESRISRPRISAMRLTARMPSQPRFLEGRLLHRAVELDERGEQRLHAIERPGVRAIGERGLGPGVGLHEHPGDAGADRG